ncbi:DUF3592 domain-containing protein [Dietzia psychralcaliphila]|uniref:DUF3592 domain-containing protein n=1 Tax=Dietzia psychralcaliphila TaxID=139021 RepID=A0AAD0JTE2_9ACTN|nr:DUF3592 domain-containing protein [Dietzia psychralcaliphila]AWH96257.1 hypothetical protein A6048_12935 [Dietzia psychralcaliphila]PTM90666.1 hypothetical protein C8N39_101420 [Dietzia psychralcaliphila]
MTRTVAARRARRSVRTRRIVRATAAVTAAFSLLTAALILLACFVNDQRIDRDMGSATATVTEVTDRRAAVEFDTGGGHHVRPVTGVFYPIGLIEGQRVQVEFRRANPDLVRVSGRSWTVAVVPALSIPAVVIPLAALTYAAASPRVHRPTPRVPRTDPR